MSVVCGGRNINLYVKLFRERGVYNGHKKGGEAPGAGHIICFIEDMAIVHLSHYFLHT